VAQGAWPSQVSENQDGCRNCRQLIQGRGKNVPDADALRLAQNRNAERRDGDNIGQTVLLSSPVENLPRRCLTKSPSCLRRTGFSRGRGLEDRERLRQRPCLKLTQPHAINGHTFAAAVNRSRVVGHLQEGALVDDHASRA
jgi:hypothetical protein